MDFTHRKLPAEHAHKMRICPIKTIRPYALMLAPIYVYMKNNCKFVAVKAPLDFFTPDELERLKPFETFFVPVFVDQSLRFRESARAIRSLLDWSYETQHGFFAAPATYELSDGVVRIMAPLWSTLGSKLGNGSVTVEPFFLAAFANELCDLIPEDLLMQSREKDVIRFESAVMGSGVAVFLAMHLGYLDREFLNRLRIEVFSKISGILDERSNENAFGVEISAIERVCVGLFSLSAPRVVQVEHLFGLDDRVWTKLKSRMNRIRTEFGHIERPNSSVYGEGGFIEEVA